MTRTAEIWCRRASESEPRLFWLRLSRDSLSLFGVRFKANKNKPHKYFYHPACNVKVSLIPQLHFCTLHQQLCEHGKWHGMLLCGNCKIYLFMDFVVALCAPKTHRLPFRSEKIAQREIYGRAGGTGDGGTMFPGHCLPARMRIGMNMEQLKLRYFWMADPTKLFVTKRSTRMTSGNTFDFRNEGIMDAETTPSRFTHS